ncbi:MAG: aminotransferase class IV [Cyclobacteriaceae bacterium]|nr:aminotransferase class IV [Cyclobacteriaceae bacterium]QOI96023.1 MAG: aminotransferase class IV [Flammeovirgaceae bacterium]
MYRLIESIRLENGVFHHLPYHQHRMDNTVQKLAGSQNQVILKTVIKKLVVPQNGIYKYRVVYTTDGEWQHELIPYKAMPIHSLKVMYDNAIKYDYKYADRSKLDMLFNKRGRANDILIVKNGLVTDTSYNNVVFYDGLRWITPAMPLLPGVMRAVLLDAGEIQEEELMLSHLNRFKKIKLINALVGFNGPEFPVTHILF